MTRIILALLMSAMAILASAAEDPHAADRHALRALLADVVNALNKHDIDAVLKHMDNDVVVTYYNGVVTKGPAAARAYYARMLIGPDAVLKAYHAETKVTTPATFYGDTAVAYGTTNETYKLSSGPEFDLHGHWTATLHKDNGVWKIAALHFSTDMFDNPLLNAANRMTWIVGAAVFIGTLVTGALVMRIRRRRALKTAMSP